MEVSMRKKFLLALIAVLFSSLAGLVFAQTPATKRAPRLLVRPGLGFEYSSRTITWDNKKYTSQMKSYFAAAGVEYDVFEKLTVAALFGYGSTNGNGLVFRNLPFSVDYEAGGIGGFVLGGELATKKLLLVGNFEIDAQAQFVYYVGSSKTFALGDLAVQGSVTGKPKWSQFIVGPVVAYKGFSYFTPYFAACFNYLSGNFKMNETVQDLTGSEDKAFKGDGYFHVAVGATYELTDYLSLKGEGRLLPRKGGLDYGALVKAVFVF